jgi:hypothetical protein
VENLFKIRVQPVYGFKTHQHLTAQLPQVLANTEKQYNERQQRIQDLTTIQDGFIQRFYPPTIYFTRRPSSLYYDGVKYFIHNEDDILHLILSSISKYQTNRLTGKENQNNHHAKIKTIT